MPCAEARLDVERITPVCSEPDRNRARKRPGVIRVCRRALSAPTKHGDSRFFSAITAFSARYAWWVVGCWVVLVAVLNALIPQLEATVAEDSSPFMPAHLPAVQTLRQMSADFGMPASSAVGSVVVVDEAGLSDADRVFAGRLVEALRADKGDVAYVLDTYSDERLRSIAVSPDGKAISVVVAGTGQIGSSEARKNIVDIRRLIESMPKPAGVQVYYTGFAPTLADLFAAIDRSLLVITGVSVVLIMVLLLVVYRSLVLAMIPLVTVGVSLGVARCVVSVLGMTGVMTVSNFTIALMTAMVLGVGTDYAIFIIAGYHEGRREGVAVPLALVRAGQRTSGILMASAVTIGVAFSAMMLTKIGMFRAVGPPVAVAVAITLMVSVTLPYALLAIAGRRGYGQPRRLDELRWRRWGARIVRRSGVLTVGSLVVLIALAVVLVTLRINFDENAMQLRPTESSIGHEKVYEHWGLNEAAPEYLIISSDHDMRNTDDLAALDVIAAGVERLPDVAFVRSITRPLGKPAEQTAVGYQVGIVGDRLGDASRHISQSAPDLQRLDLGATQLLNGAESANSQLPQLVSGVQEVARLAHEMLNSYGAASSALATMTDGRIGVPTAIADLTASLRLLDVVLDALSNDDRAVAAIGAANAALGPMLEPQLSGECLANPLCMRGRADLADLDEITNGAVGRALGILHAASALPQEAIGKVRAALPWLKTLLEQLQAMTAHVNGQPQAQLNQRLNQLTEGAQRLSGGMSQLVTGLNQVKTGVDTVVELTGRLSEGLQVASNYLDGLSAHTSSGAGRGFYLPPQGFSDATFKAGQHLLFSADGKTARMVVVWKANPYNIEVRDTARQLAETAQVAATATALHNAHFATTGIASILDDMGDQMWRDFAVFGLAAILGVLLVLMLLLRSILAPVLLVGMVCLSFAAAAGLSVLVWQHVIGIDLEFSVLPVAFMALIAVCADYSMLFAARIREESRDGMVRGIIRGFGKTGSVITTAGVVFALTMFALMSGSVLQLVQIGSTIGAGLLIDITVVRNILVPAAMALIGNRIWWPSAT
ncbi:Acyltrehalose exporter MmpL10 [Mycobacterium simulans]|nr:Acyltrehalose exporter MmpL10 [Mycobacterium simulans]